MSFPTMPRPIAAREREQGRRHPRRETLELAAAIAARTLGPDHSVTKALARAAQTMGKVDFWKARLAIRTLRRDEREAIAAAAEN
jgi:hypothetical protein